MKPIFFVLLSIILYLNASSQHNTYYIGHSGFGWDLVVGEMVNDLATDAGITSYGYGFQFIGGTCISAQWQNHASPQGGTDSHIELPTGNYNIVVLAEQIPISEVIYSSQWGCNLTSVQSVDNFYDMATAANASTRLYLMEFHNEVDQTGPNPYATWTNLNTTMRPLWEQVVDSVSLINNGPDVCIIPVAAAFQALADSVLAGSYPGLSNWIQIFDPNDAPVATIHPTEETYYLVACVHFATIFGQSPVGLTNATFAAAGWAFAPPTAAQALMMQEIAWNVVSNDPYACAPGSVGVSEIQDQPLRIMQTKNHLKLSFEAGKFENANIYDIWGRAMVSSSASSENIKLDIGDLSPGMYFYELVGNGIRQSGKFMVK